MKPQHSVPHIIKRSCKTKKDILHRNIMSDKIIGKAADLTVVQQRVIEPLHREVEHKEIRVTASHLQFMFWYRTIQNVDFNFCIPGFKPLLHHRRQKYLAWTKKEKK